MINLLIFIPDCAQVTLEIYSLEWKRAKANKNYKKAQINGLLCRRPDSNRHGVSSPLPHQDSVIDSREATDDTLHLIPVDTSCLHLLWSRFGHVLVTFHGAICHVIFKKKDGNYIFNFVGFFVCKDDG